MIQKIWKFIRGDLPVKVFEEWLYSEDSLETIFGKTLYLDMISANYSDKESIFKIKQLLKEFVHTSFPQKCYCIELPDVAVIDMGEDSEKVFKYLDEIKKRGEPYWWLSVDKCRECDQIWLVASEERQNDLYCLQRLNNQALDEILKNNKWPSLFDTYETLLRLGFDIGRSVRFVDPYESSLPYTIADLAKERPGIRISEIAKLLNLDIELAIELSKKAIKDENVQINFD
jgi:hypothetical protein